MPNAGIGVSCQDGHIATLCCSWFGNQPEASEAGCSLSGVMQVSKQKMDWKFRKENPTKKHLSLKSWENHPHNPLSLCSPYGTKAEWSPVQTVARQCPQLIFVRMVIHHLWAAKIQRKERLRTGLKLLLKDSSTVTSPQKPLCHPRASRAVKFCNALKVQWCIR